MLAVTAGSYGLATLFGSLFLIALLLTGAPRMHLLHRLPAFGAVRVAAVCTANGAAETEADGREEIVLAVPRGSLPSTVLVAIAVRNLTNREVENALFNFGFSVGNGMKRCDGWGVPVTKGDALPPSEGFDRAVIAGMQLTGNEEPLFHFRVRIREVGRYRAYISINSSSLFRSLIALSEIEVVETDSPTVRDQLAPVIDRAEAISKQGMDAFGGEDEMRRALMEVAVEAQDLLLKVGSQEFLDRFTNAEPDYIGLQGGDDYLRATAMAKTKVLYELRGELGRRESSRTTCWADA